MFNLTYQVNPLWANGTNRCQTKSRRISGGLRTPLKPKKGGSPFSSHPQNPPPTHTHRYPVEICICICICIRICLFQFCLASSPRRGERKWGKFYNKKKGAGMVTRKYFVIRVFMTNSF